MDIKSVTSAAYGRKVYGTIPYDKAHKRAAEAAATRTAGERVEISSESSELRKIKSALDSMPEVRIAVVEDIKRRIDMNDYPLENNLDESIKRLIDSEIVQP
jgi:hypothetical protein